LRAGRETISRPVFDRPTQRSTHPSALFIAIAVGRLSTSSLATITPRSGPGSSLSDPSTPDGPTMFASRARAAAETSTANAAGWISMALSSGASREPEPAPASNTVNGSPTRCHSAAQNRASVAPKRVLTSGEVRKSPPAADRSGPVEKKPSAGS